MENTTDSAKAFLLKWRDEITHPVSTDYFAELLVAYASQATPKLVLPKRKEIDHDEPIYYQKKAMIWNECIEELIRLNPELITE